MRVKITDKPILLLIIATIFCYVVTGGTLGVMNLIKCMLLFGGLWFILAFYISGVLNLSKTKTHIFILSSIPLGLILGYCCTIVSNAIYFIIFSGLGLILIGALIPLLSRKLNWENSIFFVFTLGFWIRLGRVLTCNVPSLFQHDFTWFTFDKQINSNMFHDDYILWFYNYWRLPDVDVRLNGQFYHPPLHHFICAVFLKINNTIFPSLKDNYNCLQLLTLFYSMVLLFALYKIFKLLGLDKKALFFISLMASTFPGLVLLSASVNNDMLSSMFGVLSIYVALKWYKDNKLSDIIFTAVFIGLGMMTKLSIGIVAIPVAFIFLIGLIQSMKKTKLIRQFILFAVIVFPLGLWFPIRNYINYKVPLTFVHELSGSKPQTIVGKTIFERLFDLNDQVTFIPYMVFTDETRDYNIFLSLLKTSLFDELQHQNDLTYLLIGSAMLLILVLILTIGILGLILIIRDIIRKSDSRFENLYIVILFLSFMVSAITFAFKYPMVASMNFRYIVPVVIPVGLFIGRLYSSKKLKLISYASGSLIVLLSLLSVFFIATTWAH